MKQDKIVTSEWDYSKNAEWYVYRPNYAKRAIDLLTQYVKHIGQTNFLVADIGAGTGNLTKMLLARNLTVHAVEPNDEMRKIGEKITNGNLNVKWTRATGTETTLESSSYDWVTWGSSFNVVDRNLGIQESYRLLKSKGYFSCMWNHRSLDCPIQKQAEDIIFKHVPNYSRGVRREDQRPFLEKCRDLFNNIFYIEVDFVVQRSIEEYLSAWKSVKNIYWDLDTEEGRELFNKICEEMKEKLPSSFELLYTTRAWTAQKVD